MYNNLDMKKQSIKKNIILSTFYQILKLLTPLITAPYIARVLGTDGVGTYSYTASFEAYFSLFAALGTASYGLREIARARDDVKERSQLFFEIELLSICVSLVVLLGWGIFILFQKKYQIIFVILTMNIMNAMLDISWFYNGLEQFVYTVTKNSVIKILGVVLIFLFVKQKSDLNLYIFLMCFTSLLGTMSMWISLPKFIVKPDFRHIDLGVHFRQTLIYFIPTIATSVYTILDKIMIGLITQNTYENGYYEEATKIINMMKALTFTALNSVLGARISYLFKEKQYDEIRGRINLSINYVAFMGIGICFGLIGVARRFVPVYFGPGFEKTTTILYILSPIVFIIGVSNCLGSQYYSPAGLRKESSKYIITGSLVNLVLNGMMIPFTGSYGAALASVLAELTITVLYVIHSKGYFEASALWQYSWKRFIAGVIMAAVIIMIGHTVTSGILCLVLQVSVGVMIYFILLTLMKDELIGIVKERIFSRFRKA